MGQQDGQAAQQTHRAYERDAGPVLAALADAGIDTRDFSRFVNRQAPGIIEPSHFDSEKAAPILLDWLPRVSNEKVRETIVRRLKVKTADSRVADALIEEFRRPGTAGYKWVVADTLAFTCSNQQFDVLTALAADHGNGYARGPLVAMLWRVKTEQADRVLQDAISDPDVALQAMAALRRRLGSEKARPLIAPLAGHNHERVAYAARLQLRRIDKARPGA